MSGRSFNSVFINPSRFFSRNHTLGNRQKFTVAGWLKLLAGGTALRVFDFGGVIFRYSSDSDEWRFYNSGDGSWDVRSSAMESPSVYFHFTVGVDTTQVTAANRVKVYIDGTEITYASTTYPNQNTNILNGNTFEIPSQDYNWRGLVDEFHFIDNAQLTPSSFITGTPGGPKQFSGPWGAAGFYLNFDNYSSPTAMGYDASGHSFNFTPSGDITVADNSSTDIPGIPLTGADVAIAAPVVAAAEFHSGILAANLSVGSPEISAAQLDSAAPDSIVVLPPLIGRPFLAMIGKNVLPGAVNLSPTSPLLGTARALAFNSVSLGANWDTTNNVVIGGPFIDAKPRYDAIALIDQSGETGPFEIFQTITRTAAVGVYRVLFDVAPTESGKYVEIGITDDSVGGVSATFDPETGECLARNPIVVGSTTIQSDWKLIGVEADPLLNDFYRLQIIAQVGTATSIRAYVRLVDENLQADYSGDGFGSIFVSEPRLFSGMDQRQFRWEIGEPEMRFYWTAHMAELGLRWFRCGQGQLGVDHHLEFINAPDLECVFRRWQPAQDELVFDYSGYLVAGSGNPMQGTP